MESTPAPTSPATETHPLVLCGYAVVQTLTPGECHLAIGPGGRNVTLKKLDPDCMHGALLHPDVRDRLSRIRELAHAGVANLFGVGKDESDAWLIWEYVEGKPLADHVRDASPSPRELAMLVRELALTLESLHLQGIVHGSIDSGNVIVAPDGSVHLTHVSPLLYDDPADDVEAMLYMVQVILESRGGDADEELAKLIADAREAGTPLRGLAARLAMLTDPRETTIPPQDVLAKSERRTRKRAVFGAVIVAALGCAVAYGVFRAAASAGGTSSRNDLPAWLIGRSER